jgi:hypothetical protein
VAYRGFMRLRLPIPATSLGTSPAALPRSQLTQAGGLGPFGERVIGRADPREARPMTTVRALLTVAACTAVSAAVGLGLGYGVGRLAPNFYRALFYRGDAPDFDPVDVGIGSGLNGGVFTGVVVGLVIVAIMTYREVKVAAQGQPSLPAEGQERTGPAARHPEGIRPAGRPGG